MGSTSFRVGFCVPSRFGAKFNVSADFTLCKGLGRCCRWMYGYQGVVPSVTARMGAQPSHSVASSSFAEGSKGDPRGVGNVSRTIYAGIGLGVTW